MADEQTPSDEARKDYSKAERETMAKSGAALPDGSFPIANEADLKNAIQAYGRAGDKAAAKAHIIKRAKALGLTSLLPDDWTQQNAADDALEERDDTECPTCDGTGKIMDGHRDCPDCDGTGVKQDGRAHSAEVERRQQRATELDGAREVRHFDAQNVEIRETSDGMFRFSGYASVTEHPYDVADFTETISRGAFKRTLGEQPDVVLLVNHGEGGGLPLARTKSGTMTLTEDARGLRVDADLNPQDPDVRSLVPKMQRGDVDQMSFAFRATDQEWNADYTQRTIRSVALHRGDVSIVTMGANPATTSTLSQLRSAVDDFEERSGKALSAKNRKELEGLRDGIAHLLESNDAADEPDEPDDARSDPPADPVDGASQAAARVRSVLDYTTGARAWFDSEMERCA